MFDKDNQYRILHLASSYRWTGVAEPATSIASYQIRDGHKVWFAAIWGNNFEENLEKKQIPTAKKLRIQRRINQYATFQDIKILRDFLVENQIDVVHSHLIHDHWLAALAIKRIKPPAKKPILIRTLHRHEEMRKDPFHKWLFEKVTDEIITVSQEQADLICTGYPKTRGKISIVKGGVDPEFYKPDMEGAKLIRADMGEKPGARIAGIVAHLGYTRGHKWLLEAAPAVLKAVPEAVIWIVGQGELKNWLMKEVLDPKYLGRVVMAGYRKTDLRETYSAMDVGLLLGLGSEGSARATLEAMAMEKPVIAVKKGALIETISHGENGFLVEENNVEQLSEALIKLLGNPSLCKSMGQNARETILREYTEELRHKNTIAVYEKVLQR